MKSPLYWYIRVGPDLYLGYTGDKYKEECDSKNSIEHFVVMFVWDPDYARKRWLGKIVSTTNPKVRIMINSIELVPNNLAR